MHGAASRSRFTPVDAAVHRPRRDLDGAQSRHRDFSLSDTQFGWVLSAFALGLRPVPDAGGLLADRLGPRLVLGSHRHAVVDLHRADRAGLGLRSRCWCCGSCSALAEAGAYPDLRPSLLQLAAGLRARAGAGHQFFGLAARRGLRASRRGVAGHGRRMARRLPDAWGVGVVWAAGWWRWFRDTPEDHRGVSAAERGRSSAAGRGTPRPPPRRASARRVTLSRSPNMWVAMGQYFASNFTFFFCLTWLFPYLQRTYQLEPCRPAAWLGIRSSAARSATGSAAALVDRCIAGADGASSRQHPAISGFCSSAARTAGQPRGSTPFRLCCA